MRLKNTFGFRRKDDLAIFINDKDKLISLSRCLDLLIHIVQEQIGSDDSHHFSVLIDRPGTDSTDPVRKGILVDAGEEDFPVRTSFCKPDTRGRIDRKLSCV